jgi:hypothetical protein
MHENRIAQAPKTSPYNLYVYFNSIVGSFSRY